MSEAAAQFAIAGGGFVLFACGGAVSGWVARNHARNPSRVLIGGAFAWGWLYLFVQLPAQISLMTGRDLDDVAIVMAAGGLLMALLWLAGAPKRLPVIGAPISHYEIASEKWLLARALKRIERLERELDQSTA